MEHHRPRKHRGPGVWALVRDAYLAGEPAPRVAELGDRLLHLAEAARRLRPITLEQAAQMTHGLRELVETAAQATVDAALSDPDRAPPPLRAWARAWRTKHVEVGA